MKHIVRLRLNPMSLASAGLLFAAAFLPWMSLVTLAVVRGLAFPVFGVQSTLWELAGPFAPIALKPIVPLMAGLFTLAGAFGVLIRGRVGAILSLAGLLIFAGGTEDIFGVHVVASALTVVAPASGIEWAAAGMIVAAVSYRFPARAIEDLVRGVRSPQSLARIGLFLACTFLAIDAVDHASGGELFAVFGSSAEELSLHALFIGSTALLAAVFLLRRAWFDGRAGAALIAAGGIGLVLDAIYHATRGNLAEFVGHTGAEMVAHVATYYGIALLIISRFAVKSS